ncbi:hypothetical protein QTH91_15370 [Variovorax dokdonensis]|uniref:Uncharacterized protein n=1 Tax=Variovorax dokdonensis TaxID=344883 RepID=A0ABT7ND49_9BURK|nr:hypothetical protein [Variovorax dokdonensis]MDM0045867.1 hypothetical protein [Variovorax dokdonensis]
MRIPKMVWAGVVAALAAALGATAAHGAGQYESTLDGHPSVTRYVSNDAPFVVFGVTPTHLDGQGGPLTLTFIATDRLEQVNVFPFVRSAPGGQAVMRSKVACGPRDAGSWNCSVPVADLLERMDSSEGQLGLRIEAQGELHDLRQHSTVIVTLPVRRRSPSL